MKRNIYNTCTVQVRNELRRHVRLYFSLEVKKGVQKRNDFDVQFRLSWETRGLMFNRKLYT